MVGHRRRVWGETGYLFLVPSAKLHLPMLPWTSFQEMLQPELFNIIKFVFEFVIKPSFSITQLSMNRKEGNYGLGLLTCNTYLE